jgi:hypothetical protein
VVLDVVGSNPTSRPRINNLRGLSGNQTFTPQNLDALGLNSQRISKLQKADLAALYLICSLQKTICLRGGFEANKIRLASCLGEAS